MSASVGTRFISVAAQDHLQWEAIFLRIHLIKIHFLSQVQNSSEHFKKLFHEEFFMKLFFCGSGEGGFAKCAEHAKGNPVSPGPQVNFSLSVSLDLQRSHDQVDNLRFI